MSSRKTRSRQNPQPIPKWKVGDLLWVGRHDHSEADFLVWVLPRKGSAKVILDLSQLKETFPLIWDGNINIAKDCEWTFFGNARNVEKFDE